jgi:dihydropyrimidine dehydrogenase (NAD+) subunit PreA
MSDILEVNFAGLKLRNPVILGSATPSWDGATSRQAGLAGASAVVPKTIGSPEALRQHPRAGRLKLIRLGRGRPFGMVNTEIYSTLTLDDWLERELAISSEGGAKMIASVVAEPNPRETVDIVRKLQATGHVHMIELNVSCPMPDAQVGYRIGQDVDLVCTQVGAVKEIASLPVGVKMTPNVSDMVPIARAAKEAGADFLTISNSVRSLAGVDIETGRPHLPAYGGYTGPAIKPIIQRFVSEVARTVDIPISAIGGIRTWEDAVEYLMLGATTVQTVTAVMWDGYDALSKMISGLRRFMERKGYRSVDDFRGMSLPHIVTIQEYAGRPQKWAALIQNKCNACKLCFQVCFYDALHDHGNGIPQIVRENCDGCGLCVEICPRRALILE